MPSIVFLNRKYSLNLDRFDDEPDGCAYVIADRHIDKVWNTAHSNSITLQKTCGEGQSLHGLIYRSRTDCL